MKPVPRRLVLDWILSARKSLPNKIVASSFKKCALRMDGNGEKDGQISCFKPGRPYADGYEILKEQMLIFSEQQNTDNLFEITEPG